MEKVRIFSHFIELPPSFTSSEDDSVGGHGAFRWVHVSLDPKSVTLAQCAAAAIFLWAWHHQRVAHQILARIRLVLSVMKLFCMLI